MKLSLPRFLSSSRSRHQYSSLEQPLDTRLDNPLYNSEDSAPAGNHQRSVRGAHPWRERRASAEQADSRPWYRCRTRWTTWAASSTGGTTCRPRCKAAYPARRCRALPPTQAAVGSAAAPSAPTATGTASRWRTRPRRRCICRCSRSSWPRGAPWWSSARTSGAAGYAPQRSAVQRGGREGEGRRPDDGDVAWQGDEGLMAELRGQCAATQRQLELQLQGLGGALDETTLFEALALNDELLAIVSSPAAAGNETAPQQPPGDHGADNDPFSADDEGDAYALPPAPLPPAPTHAPPLQSQPSFERPLIDLS
eukprot:scaffold785_cov286-Prasinococcus_capsulatus_cf.AAC.3